MITAFKNIVPALAAFAVAPFAAAAETVPAAELVPAAETVPAAELVPAAEPASAPAEISPETRTLFLQGLGWIVAQNSGLIQDLGVSAEDAPAIAEGFRLALCGEGRDLPEKIVAQNEAYSVFIEGLQKAAQEKILAEMKAAAEGNRKLGEAYVASLKNEDKAFVELPSGVLMKISKPGNAAEKPTPENVVSVRYTGRLIDGTIFDSSASDDNGVPVPFVEGEGATVEFPLRNLIPAWIEAIPRLGVGGVCTLVVPADLAYGDRPAGIIPPGSTLTFEIELAGISEAEPEIELEPAELAPAASALDLE